MDVTTDRDKDKESSIEGASMVVERIQTMCLRQMDFLYGMMTMASLSPSSQFVIPEHP